MGNMSYPTEFIRIKNFIEGEWQGENDVNRVPLFYPSDGTEIGHACGLADLFNSVNLSAKIIDGDIK
jgi:hypothetical protein